MPLFYFSNPAAVLGPRDDVAISPGSQQWDYELEIAAVIGRGGRTARALRTVINALSSGNYVRIDLLDANEVR